MFTEIERKYLVTSDGWRREAGNGVFFRQAYVMRTGGRCLRVRTIDNIRGLLTVKIRVGRISRDEFEYDIPCADAEEMINRANSLVIEKTRYQLRHMGHLWEIDAYEGAHTGLVIAEVELKDEGECVALPAWVGREVTGDRRYSNQALSRWSMSDRPFQGHAMTMLAAAT